MLFPAGTFASLSSYKLHPDTSLSIHIFAPASYNMSPGNGESGYGSSGSDNQESSHGNRNVGFVPASADTTSRRRNMNIEDMLNPSDESTIRHQQPQSSNSYEAGGTVSRNPHSLQGSRVPRSGRHSHGVNASAGSRQGSHPPSVRRSRGSRTPDVPPRTRGFRPAYSTEEGHFIWYLRLDVRICRHTLSWPNLYT